MKTLILHILPLMAVLATASAGTKPLCTETGTSQRRISASHHGGGSNPPRDPATYTYDPNPPFTPPFRRNTGSTPNGFPELDEGQRRRFFPNIPQASKFYPEGFGSRKKVGGGGGVGGRGGGSAEYDDMDGEDYDRFLDEEEASIQNKIKKPSSGGVSPRGDESQSKPPQPPGNKPVTGNVNVRDDDEEEDGGGDIIVIHQEYHKDITPQRERYPYPYYG